MKTTEMVMNYLKEQGLMPAFDEDNDVKFKFNMLTFYFFNNDDDERYFRMGLPNIYDVTEDNRIAVLEAVNEVNKVYKVAKVMVVRDSVWIATEMLMDTTPVLEDFIPRLLNIMVGARKEFYDQIEG